MFACCMCLAQVEPDGSYYMKNEVPPADSYEDFCHYLDIILKRYNINAVGSEIDTSRNCVMILTTDKTRKICVVPNYFFNCMDGVSIEEVKQKVEDAIRFRIVHKCIRCGCIEIVHCDNVREMVRRYNDLPDDWMKVYGGKLCPSCANEYRKILDKFLKNNSGNS